MLLGDAVSPPQAGPAASLSWGPSAEQGPGGRRSWFGAPTARAAGRGLPEGQGKRVGRGREESGQIGKVGCQDLLPCKRGRKNRGPREDSLEQCGPSLAVNPVFDPAEDGKAASASRARPSVSGTRQSPARSGSGLPPGGQ